MLFKIFNFIILFVVFLKLCTRMYIVCIYTLCRLRVYNDIKCLRLDYLLCSTYIEICYLTLSTLILENYISVLLYRSFSSQS